MNLIRQLHIGVTDVLKLGSYIDTVPKNINIANHKVRCEANNYFWCDTTARLNASFIYQLNNSIKEHMTRRVAFKQLR